MLIIPLIKTKHNFFQSAYFSSIIIEWNKLDPTIRNAKGFGIIKSNILTFIRSTPFDFFTVITIKELD